MKTYKTRFTSYNRTSSPRVKETEIEETSSEILDFWTRMVANSDNHIVVIPAKELVFTYCGIVHRYEVLGV